MRQNRPIHNNQVALDALLFMLFYLDVLKEKDVYGSSHTDWICYLNRQVERGATQVGRRWSRGLYLDGGQSFQQFTPLVPSPRPVQPGVSYVDPRTFPRDE